MNINIETKYNVGDKVYTIIEVEKYNDWYRNETHWIVMEDKDKYYNELLTPLEIERIIINQYKKSYEILYKIKNYTYSEEYMFDTLEMAQNECKKRNKE